MKKLLTWMLLIVFVWISFTGCGSNTGNKPSETDKVSVSSSPTPVETASTQGNTSNEPALEDVIKQMTLEEKAGQVFMMALRPLYKDEDTPLLEINEDVTHMIQNYNLGGIILFAENIDTIPQTKNLISDMQKASKYPMFMSVDEESGSTSRLRVSGKMHSTKTPKNSILGSTHDPELSKKVGNLIAKEISSLGFNMDLAPVADVNTNPKNPVIGDRSFGADPELVSQMVIAQVEGMHEQNIIPVLKHFPGHGDTALDSHTGAVTIEHNRDRMDKIELYPFKKAIEAGADAIMTAHISVPKLTGDTLPATLSKTILTDLLRNELKFDGLILTDAMEMGAISQFWGPEEATLRAFEAGADIILIPISLDESYKALINAVKSGRISEERLNQSVRRILLAKLKYGIWEGKNNGLDPEAVLGCKEHQDIVCEVMEKAGKK
ncbi:MAG: glycoside hydrolase [Clostridia bacterium]|nr:glycoside hydrolase [Clostridia bacterium]